MKEVYKKIDCLILYNTNKRGLLLLCKKVGKQVTHKKTMRWIVAHHHRKSCCLQAWKIGT